MMGEVLILSRQGRIVEVRSLDVAPPSLFSREGGSPVWVPAFAGKQSWLFGRASRNGPPPFCRINTARTPPRRRPGPRWKGQSNGAQRQLATSPNWTPASAGEVSFRSSGSTGVSVDEARSTCPTTSNVRAYAKPSAYLALSHVTRSPSAIPSSAARPPISSSTAPTGSPDGIGASENGTAFSAILAIVPSARM